MSQQRRRNLTRAERCALLFGDRPTAYADKRLEDCAMYWTMKVWVSGSAPDLLTVACRTSSRSSVSNLGGEEGRRDRRGWVCR